MSTHTRSFVAALACLLVGTTTAGCFDEAITNPVYDGAPQVQFDPISSAVPDGAGEVALDIALIAPHQDEDSRFPITIPQDTITTVASDGYALLTETATIPADNSFGEVIVQVDSSGIAPGESELLGVQLQDSEDGQIVPAENFRFFTLEIVGRAANVAVDPASIGFGEVATDSTAQDTLFVSNATDGLEGNTFTDISNLEITGDSTDVFEIVEPMETSFRLAPDESRQVIVEFAPADTVGYEAALGFAFTNDSDASDLSVALSGTGTLDGEDDDAEEDM